MKKKHRRVLALILIISILLLTLKLLFANEITIEFNNDSVVVKNLDEEAVQEFITNKQKEVETIIENDYSSSYKISHKLVKQSGRKYMLSFSGTIDHNKAVVVENNKLEISEYKYIEGDDYIQFSFTDKISYDMSNTTRFEIGTINNDAKKDKYVLVSNTDSYSVVVNKERRYTSEFIPNNLSEITVKSQKSGEDNLIRADIDDELVSLFDDAKKQGYDLTVTSAYRSYNTQEALFNSYVSSHGYDKAVTFSAFAGASEHQTGLVVDIGSLDTMDINFSSAFGNTDEGKWLNDNAHKYGFILRYPEGKEDITTYIYEPWHFRYVGVELATYLYNENITLEEFFNLQ